MFLGLNLDAYVVIGKVYCDNRLLENATEHVGDSCGGCDLFNFHWLSCLLWRRPG